MGYRLHGMDLLTVSHADLLGPISLDTLKWFINEFSQRFPDTSPPMRNVVAEIVGLAGGDRDLIRMVLGEVPDTMVRSNKFDSVSVRIRDRLRQMFPERYVEGVD
jgi:hypothetical protein